jgi:hypothetical protein
MKSERARRLQWSGGMNVPKSRCLKSLLLLALTALPIAASAEAKTPQTAADHLQLAAQYQEKATAYRHEAKYHRDMIEEYRRSAAPPTKGQPENPWVKNMVRHCRAFIDDAEKLAADADLMAEFHRLRAKELSGQ